MTTTKNLIKITWLPNTRKGSNPNTRVELFDSYDELVSSRLEKDNEWMAIADRLGLDPWDEANFEKIANEGLTDCVICRA